MCLNVHVLFCVIRHLAPFLRLSAYVPHGNDNMCVFPIVCINDSCL